MGAWAAANVPELDDPLNANIIAAFKDHYRNGKDISADPDAAFRQWLRHEPEHARRRNQSARQRRNERNKAGSLIETAINEARNSDGC